MGHQFFFIFFPYRLLLPHLPHLIILSPSPSSFFKQSLHIGMKIVNKHSLWTAIELGPPVSESSSKISKFHAPTDSKHKFHKAGIKNWLPIEFKLRFPWLRIRRHNHQLGTPWAGVPLLKLCKCSRVPLLASASNRTETKRHWLNHLQILQKH